MLAQRPRPTYTSSPNDGSRTMTIHDVPTPEASCATSDDGGSTSVPPLVPVLKLRGGPPGQQRVSWREEVVDNENAGKKKSKICCIYHKPKRFDESSDESSSDSDTGRAKPPRRSNHRHHHSHNESSGGPSGSGIAQPGQDGSSVTQVQQLPSATNAYDTVPRHRSDKGKVTATQL